MTPMQVKYLEAIKRLTKDGVAPTYQEIADDIGVAKSAAWHAVRRLVERGYVVLGDGNASRTIRMVRLDGLADLKRLPSPMLISIMNRIVRELMDRGVTP